MTPSDPGPVTPAPVPMPASPMIESPEVARQRDLLAACERFEHDWREGIAADLETYLVGVPPHHQPLVLATLEELLGELQSEALGQDSSRPPSRFEILRPLASGGMGVVFEALDREFERSVALKEILPAGADDETYRQRFLTEAAITGRLEHPGIIPVYSRGSQADGRPFYAMRLISGEQAGTLQQALRQFHDVPPADPAERDLAWRALLRRVIDVCNTMAYAHSQGVLHRDLKPANILLGPYGETLVVDWGLAKDLRHPNTATGSKSAPETDLLSGGGTSMPPLPPQSSPSACSASTQGIGTLGYASPEQLRGTLQSPGPHSDIYSLGTILYAVMTGKSPFPTDPSTDPSTLLQKVCAGDFIPPRQENRQIDRPLEAICLKAMSRHPDERYATATSLAADLERYLAGESVSAWQEPWTVRVRRWVGRRRTLVSTLGVALALTAIATSALALVQIRNRQALAHEASKLEAAYRLALQEQQTAERERAAAAIAREQAETERNRAIEGEALAVQAIDEFRNAVASQPELSNSLALTNLRRELLQKPLAFYRQLQNRLQALPHPSLENLESLRQATFELAGLQGEVGDVAEAVQLYETVIRLCDQGLAHPDLHDAAHRQRWQRARIAAHLNIGRWLVVANDTARELAEYDVALAELERLGQEHPVDPEWDILRASALAGKGEALIKLNRLKEANVVYAEAIQRQRRNVARHPQALSSQRDLVNSLLNRARLQDQLNQPAQAEELRQQAETLLAALGENRGTDPQVRHRNAANQFNRGCRLQNEGQLDEALQAYRKAAEEWGRLVLEFPSSNEFAHARRQALVNLVIVLNQPQQNVECLQTLEQLVDMDRALHRRNPGVLELQAQLLESLHSEGHLLMALGRGDKGVEPYLEALALAEGLLAAQPGDRRWARQVVDLNLHLADLSLNAGESEAACRRLETARPVGLGLVAAGAVEPMDRNLVHGLLGTLAGLQEFLGETSAAQETRQLALHWDQRDPLMQALDARLREVLNGTRGNSGTERIQLARRAMERLDYESALKLLSEALQDEPALVKNRQVLPGYLEACLALRMAAALPEERSSQGAQLRQRARDRLQQELEHWREVGPELTDERRFALNRWRTEPALIPVLRPAELARLPAAEQQSWRELFAAAARLANE